MEEEEEGGWQLLARLALPGETLDDEEQDEEDEDIEEVVEEDDKHQEHDPTGDVTAHGQRGG